LSAKSIVARFSEHVKRRPRRHVNEPTSRRWVPSSLVPASSTTEDPCTRREIWAPK
jgi:hypothetical protein